MEAKEIRIQDAKVLKEVQRNAQMAIKALDAISDKVYDDDLKQNIEKQTLEYSKLNNKAKEVLLRNKAEIYKDNVIENMMLAGGIHTNTFLNTSTSHIAKLMIKGSTNGISEMVSVMNENTLAGRASMEIARELVDFEEETIERLKQFL